MPAHNRSLLARAKSRADQLATPILLSMLVTSFLALVCLIGISGRPVLWFSVWMVVSVAAGPVVGRLLERKHCG